MSKVKTVYVENCYLCQQSKRAFELLDWFHVLRWESLQNFEDISEFESFTRESLTKEIHLVTSGGNTLKGYQAIRYLFLRMPLTLYIGLMISIPGI
ncbi:hypothetical protein GCM10010954_35200 [Halobacillus andaensis]|uniref:DUF393 domain-containing protein n=1 Tax=Halobacillus andaensis TaxID=1176239 RepID=A0A917BAM1_HALAA|nr:DCC1-like thiol-disulfide oxidoreductase family protein [Halobacillus andaensis]GGF32993.1 hypothetical protein GCM10010954_35200 [Halobacillus andaensis]